MDIGRCGPSSCGNRCDNASSSNCGGRSSRGPCTTNRSESKSEVRCGSRVTSSSNSDVMTVTATPISNASDNHFRRDGGGGERSRGGGSHSDNLLAIRSRDFAAMRLDFQCHIDLAQEAITQADEECQNDHDGYHSQAKPTTLQEAQALDSFMQAQVSNARQMKKRADDALTAANVQVAALSAEAIALDAQQKTHPSTEIHERYHRKVFQVNLEKERLGRIVHAAQAREGQLSHALFRKNETEHILAGFNKTSTVRRATESADAAQTAHSHPTGQEAGGHEVSQDAENRSEEAQNRPTQQPPAADAAPAPVTPSLAGINAQRGMALSGLALALRPNAAMTTLTTGIDGGLASSAGSRIGGAAIGAAISEIGAAALGIAKIPIGVGLLAYSGKVGEGSDKVPGSSLSQRLVAVTQVDSDIPTPAPLARFPKSSPVNINPLEKNIKAVVKSASEADAAGQGRQPGLKGDSGVTINAETSEGTREQCAVRDGTRRPERMENRAEEDGYTKPNVSKVITKAISAENAGLVGVGTGKISLTGQGNNKTILVPVADNLAGVKLENPLPDQDSKTILISPDQGGKQGARHTGNAEGKPNTGGNTTVTSITDSVTKAESAYVSENESNRANLGNFTGQSGSPINVLPGVNPPTIIDGREYSAHAIDRMQGRGIPPSAVDNAIKTGETYPTNPGTTGYFDSVNKLRVITNSESGAVVTVIPGAPSNEKK